MDKSVAEKTDNYVVAIQVQLDQAYLRANMEKN